MEAAALAALISREASLSLTEEAMDSHKLRPKEGVLKESMKEEPKSPIVIKRKKDLSGRIGVGKPGGRGGEEDKRSFI